LNASHRQPDPACITGSRRTDFQSCKVVRRRGKEHEKSELPFPAHVKVVGSEEQEWVSPAKGQQEVDQDYCREEEEIFKRVK